MVPGFEKILGQFAFGQLLQTPIHGPLFQIAFNENKCLFENGRALPKGISEEDLCFHCQQSVESIQKKAIFGSLALGLRSSMYKWDQEVPWLNAMQYVLGLIVFGQA